MGGLRHPALRLLGRWRLTRVIADSHAGQEGRFTGEAELFHDAAPDRLRWEERGEMRLGGHAGPASRAYLWRLHPPDRAEVLYEDGRFFHLARVRGASCAVRHDCGPDLYEGEYLFDAPDRWRLVWRVRGPRKDYRMETLHERIG